MSTTGILDLCDVKVDGYDKTAEFYDDVYVQELTIGGGMKTEFVWMDDDCYGDEGEFPAGWYDTNNDYAPLEREQVTIKPGQGLWNYAGTAELTFNWPKVEVK